MTLFTIIYISGILFFWFTIRNAQKQKNNEWTIKKRDDLFAVLAILLFPVVNIAVGMVILLSNLENKYNFKTIINKIFYIKEE